MEILISVIIILVLMLLGAKVYESFLVGSLAYVLFSGAGQNTIGSLTAFALNNSTLLAVPLFMLAGGLMEVSGIADRLIDFASVLLRKIKNGMGATIPLASMFFGALCGSGTATCAVLGNIMVPKMERQGWNRRYTAALLAASGPLGYMIPPNMNAILYSTVSNTSVAALFLASVIPGIIWGVLYILLNRFLATKWVKKAEYEANGNDASVMIEDARFHTGNYGRDIWNSFKYSIPAWILPVIIMGGIYGGICTATEAGAVGCVYALIIGIVLKQITLKNGFNEFVKSGKSLSTIFIIMPMVSLISRYMLIEGAPQMIVTFFSSISSNNTVILLLILLLLFIMGMFFDANILTLVLTPLLMPTVQMLGMNPIQFGVIMFVAIGIGTITPPMAMNLFVMSSVSGVSVRDMVKPLLPFLLFAAIPVLLLTAFIPALSLWLPHIVMGIPM